MKSKRQLLLINASLLLGMLILVAYYLFMDENYSVKKPISDEKRLSLELRISLYPDDAAVKKYYSDFLKDGVITKAEYVTLVDLEEKYMNYLSQSNSKTSVKDQEAKSELEIEKENLEAFDRIGAVALPPELIGPAREAIVDNIALLEKQEIEKNKPN